ERVTGAVADFNIDSLSCNVHTNFERSNLVRRDPPIEITEEAQHRDIDFLNLPGISGPRAVIHDTRGKSRLMDRGLNRQAAAHGPPERTNVLCVYIGTIGEIVERRFQIAYRALLPKTALELTSFRTIHCDSALVEIHRKRHVPIRRQLLGLFLQ